MMIQQRSPLHVDERARRYAEAALSGVLQELQSSPPGGRALSCFRLSARIGGLLSSGLLDQEAAALGLIEAAVAAGLPHREAHAHVMRGLQRGAESPDSLPRSLGSSTAPRAQTFACAHEPVLSRVPDPRSVSELWGSATAVDDDEAVSGWLQTRALCPGDVADWDLARALPAGLALPSWARTKAGDWRESSHRLLVPLFTESGHLASLRARAITTGARPAKSLAPTGFQTKGLVFACPLARHVLAGDDLSWWSSPSFVISEGEPSYLTWASRHRETRATGPAYLGIAAGSWTDGIAARIPDEATVFVRTDRDEAGQRYAQAISATLAERCDVYIPSLEESR